MTPTHFVLNNEDLAFEIMMVGTEQECLDFVRKFETSDPPYDYKAEEQLGPGMHRFDYYLGSVYVLPIGEDLNSTPTENPVASTFVIVENEGDD